MPINLPKPNYRNIIIDAPLIKLTKIASLIRFDNFHSPTQIPFIIHMTLRNNELL